jgi:ribosome biogenesis GTPase A
LATSSRGPTTTELPQEVTLEAGGRQIRLIDTPGLSWESDESVEDLDDVRARDILMRSKGRIDRLKDPALAGTCDGHNGRQYPNNSPVIFFLPQFRKLSRGRILKT